MDKTFETILKQSNDIEEDLKNNSSKYRVLTGDRPTGDLHIGHLFGSLENRIRLQNLGVETFIVIADYQVLVDREIANSIPEYTKELVIDYIAAGLDPENGKTFIFPHSYVPELNQLLIPFSFLITNSELDRNPTIKEEIQSSQVQNICAGMYMYPIHQAADILSMGGNIIPVGKDQLPHLELARTIAKRFNKKFDKIFTLPQPLLSNAPLILGLDGSQKMSKSRNNAVMLKSTPEETIKLINGAATDSERFITYDPINRPQVANLLKLISLTTGKDPLEIAEEIGNGGGSKLKQITAETLNLYLAPLRQRRNEIKKDENYIKNILKRGIEKAREEAQKTLKEVRRAMKMDLF